MSTLYAVNLRTFGLSRYTGLDPVAVVEHDGTTYLASSSNLKVFGGELDGTTPIDGVVETGALELDTSGRKRTVKVYLTPELSGLFEVRVCATDAESDAEVWWPTVREHLHRAHARYKPGRGLMGRLWRIRVSWSGPPAGAALASWDVLSEKIR